jgi:methylmalonyl-CoA mutase N-terminal domain/subunit
MVAAIEQGFPQREIAESAYRSQQAFERHEAVVVGVNAFTSADDPPVEILHVDDGAAGHQVARLARVRATRDRDRVGRALSGLRTAAASTANLMPPMLEAARAYATIGEMCDALREVWGEHEEVVAF